MRLLSLQAMLPLEQLPTGGVQAPTAKPATNTTPNNTGETPASIIPGKRTGVRSKIAGLTSINDRPRPTNERRKLQH